MMEEYKTFEEYLKYMGYSWNDFDRPSELNNLIEQYSDEKYGELLFTLINFYWFVDANFALGMLTDNVQEVIQKFLDKESKNKL